MRNLPVPIHQKTIPQIFSVSAVASSDPCLLNCVFQSSSNEDVLLEGPHAVLGRIAHTLVEKAISSIARNGDATLVKLDKILNSILDGARERLSRNPATDHYSDLPHTMSPLAWARKRRAMLDQAYEASNKAPPYVNAHKFRNNGTYRFENLQRDGQWVEVPIEVPELRLKGRMDVLDRCGKQVKITEIKSGRVEDENGEIVERIARQIRLYALMANWLEPSADFVLSILADVERPILYDTTTRHEILDWLRSRMDQLPPGSTVSCESLAQLGQNCRWCAIRHRCERYLLDAPSLWANNLNWSLPLDVWGRIDRINPSSHGLVDLTLWDAGGRHVKIFRLRDAHLNGIRTGGRIYLFNLLAPSTDLCGGQWRHPLNFYEMGDSTCDRAWSLQVFSDIQGS